VLRAILQAKAHPYDLLLARGQGVQRAGKLAMEIA
jgi:hypothetical protein